MLGGLIAAVSGLSHADFISHMLGKVSTLTSFLYRRHDESSPCRCARLSVTQRRPRGGLDRVKESGVWCERLWETASPAHFLYVDHSCVYRYGMLR